jgi:hypothetical protein
MGKIRSIDTAARISLISSRFSRLYNFLMKLLAGFHSPYRRIRDAVVHPACQQFSQRTRPGKPAAIDSTQGLDNLRQLRREVGHHAGLFDVAVYNDFFRAGLQLRRCLPEVEVTK